MTRWCVFISGRGSNLAAAIEECRESGPRISLVVSSDAKAGGLAKARRAGIPSIVAPTIAPTIAPRLRIDWIALDRELQFARIDALLLLGFMKIVPPDFLEKWRGRIFNLHPSLLPNFPGLHSIERAFKVGAPLGATIHVVEPEVDAGQIVKQSASPMAKCQSTAEFLVHVTEQILVRNFLVRTQDLEVRSSLWN
jgi:phosphoribosylglycinamide formyltransferase-1